MSIFGLAELEHKRRALLVEAEVCREALRLETRNLLLYTSQVRRRYSALFAMRHLLWLALPLLRRSRSRRRSRLGFVPLLFASWKAYRTYGPMLKRLLPLLRRGAGAASIALRPRALTLFPPVTD